MSHSRETKSGPEDAYRVIFERSLDTILIVDAGDGRILEANASTGRVLGYARDALLGKRVAEFHGPVTPSSGDSEQPKLQGNDMALEGVEYLRADGSICPMDVTAMMIPWNAGTAIVMTLRDITERRRMEKELETAATYDVLTGLLNRRRFMEQLEMLVNGAKRHAFPLSLALCDVDKFKSVNDTYGHAAGDEVLAEFGRLVKESIRTEDFAGRYGGDEFCVVFPHVPAAKAAQSLERFRQRLSEAVFRTKDGRTFSISATFGIADLGPGTLAAKDFLEAADQALYRAKDAGRNRIAIN